MKVNQNMFSLINPVAKRNFTPKYVDIMLNLNEKSLVALPYDIVENQIIPIIQSEYKFSVHPCY